MRRAKKHLSIRTKTGNNDSNYHHTAINRVNYLLPLNESFVFKYGTLDFAFGLDVELNLNGAVAIFPRDYERLGFMESPPILGDGIVILTFYNTSEANQFQYVTVYSIVALPNEENDWYVVKPWNHLTDSIRQWQMNDSICILYGPSKGIRVIQPPVIDLPLVTFVGPKVAKEYILVKDDFCQGFSYKVDKPYCYKAEYADLPCPPEIDSFCGTTR